MAIYKQTYLGNLSELNTLTQNQITQFNNLELTSTTTEVLTLSGMVYGGTLASYSPISGAQVTIYNSDGTALNSTTTDTNGAYTLTFDGSLNSSYTIIGSATDYDSTNDTVTFGSSLFASASLLLPLAETINTIYGTIVDTNGTGIEGAAVYISNTAGAVLVTSLSDGSFVAYGDFTIGTTYNITASKLGYLSTTQSVTYPLTRNILNANLTLTLNTSNFSAITGRIVIAGSSPAAGIPNALVGLFSYNATTGIETLIRVQLSDEYGDYAFTDVTPNAQYRIRAIKVEQIS